MARRVLAARESALEQVLAVLGPADRQRLDSLVSTLLEGLAESPDEALRICRLCDMRSCGHGTHDCPLTRTREATITVDQRSTVPRAARRRPRPRPLAPAGLAQGGHPP